MIITSPFKPNVLVLICSAGLCAASAGLYIKSRTPDAPVQPVPVVATVATAPQIGEQPTPVPPATPAPEVTATLPLTPASTAEVKSTFTTAQIDQWVAPIALYPDALLSQVLMAATYPTNVAQAVQWSRDNPTKQGDNAIQAVSDQPWDASIKSLVAFPQLMALMGENPEWVKNLGDAFLAQPQDVMDSVQKLRRLAQQTGSLKSTVEQKVVTTTRKAAPVKSHESENQDTTSVASTTTIITQPDPEPTIITIEPTKPDVIYIPNYNPTVVYGSWENTAYPPVYLPPPAGEPFVDSFVRGFGYSMGVATTYALFSNIDWDDDHHDHHHDDDNHHNHNDDYRDGNGWQHNGDNININVNNFNRITGEHLTDKNMRWQHNPNYRDGVPYHDQDMAKRFHQTNVNGGMSTTQLPAQSRDIQRQAAASQFQQRTHSAPVTMRDTQRQAASQQFHQREQQDDFRDYALPRRNSNTSRFNGEYHNREDGNVRPPQRQLTQQQREKARKRYDSATPEQRQAFREKAQNQQRPLSQQQRDSARQRIQSATPEQRQVFRENRLNDTSRVSRLSSEQRSAVRERLSERGARRLER
ncbi:DUF3300 domain-containing protein [Escherichia fergusonii]|uniref:DUF3300 domain-containing protein n=1 Tax=Escherichia fergusonii TaxID=564 RepID=UPI0015EA243D|nr:DUF3300 domain-containing protein [Escherichia fergusonii]QMC72602.1 DUF3300 domain-containing protein [Escherichia fergusonii]